MLCTPPKMAVITFSSTMPPSAPDLNAAPILSNGAKKPRTTAAIILNIPPNNLTATIIGGIIAFAIASNESDISVHIAENVLVSLFISPCINACFAISSDCFSKSSAAAFSFSFIFCCISMYFLYNSGFDCSNFARSFCWFCCLIISAVVIPAALASASC